MIWCCLSSPLSPPKHPKQKNSSAAKPAKQHVALARRASVAARYAPVEVAQVAGEAGFIFGVALTMTAITLLVSFSCFFGVSLPPRRSARRLPLSPARPRRSSRLVVVVSRLLTLLSLSLSLHPQNQHNNNNNNNNNRASRSASCCCASSRSSRRASSKRSRLVLSPPLFFSF